MTTRTLYQYIKVLTFGVTVMVCGSNSAKAGAIIETDTTTVYEIVEANASFPGGERACIEWLCQNLHYPAEAMEQGIQGRVMVQFVVNKDGSLSEIRTLRSPSELLSREAERAVSEMPRWIPARVGNKTVRSRFNLPINFRINQDSVATQQPATPTGAVREEGDDDLVYEAVEENACFPGGERACYEWLSQNIHYPAVAMEQGIQGRVMVQFVVDRDGSLTDIKVIRSPFEPLSREAERVVAAMPKWKPAMQGGKPVRSRFNLPINFALRAGKQQNGNQK
ncbi:MAG: energy transducer TonB [Bacteroidaceae bacterium]|nr:energy transducer TonB [Bacteroidaceae bacterium]